MLRLKNGLEITSAITFINIKEGGVKMLMSSMGRNDLKKTVKLEQPIMNKRREQTFTEKTLSDSKQTQKRRIKMETYFLNHTFNFNSRGGRN